jgi:ketosteroid isomerase-like protein
MTRPVQDFPPRHDRTAESRVDTTAAPRSGGAVAYLPGDASRGLDLRQINPRTHNMADNEALVRNAYNLAEVKDIPGWFRAFAENGTFTDMSTGVTYWGESLGDLVEIYRAAFSDMRREIYRVYTTGHVVVVQLALQGTFDGPLVLTTGTIPPTGRRMDAPCCDVVELVGGKIKRFDSCPCGTVIMAQLGALAGAWPWRIDAARHRKETH